MKAVKLLALMIFLLLPAVYADVALDSFSSKVYNYGSKVSVSGTVTETISFRAQLDFNLVCAKGSAKLASLILNLKANSPSSFSQLVTLPNTILGSCTLNTFVRDGSGNLIESREDPAFAVSNDLSAVFQGPKGSYQLGEVFVLQGTVSRDDANLVD